MLAHSRDSHAVLVALSPIYRGEHDPTDVLASLLFSALSLTATSVLSDMALDTVKKISLKPTSRRSSHVRTG
jgi:hypothetical protein